MSSPDCLLVHLPAPRDRQDAILLATVAPLLRELGSSPHLDAAYFERFNKPGWGLRIHLLGTPDWLRNEARPLLERRMGAAAAGLEFVPEDPHDKWVGGLGERDHLKKIYHLDTLACLERIAAEAGGALPGSRAQFSLLLVERLLDLFGLVGAGRLEFYRRGFQWEVDLKRWDEEVFAALEEQYDSQKEALHSTLECLPGEEPGEVWGGPESAGIARRLLAAARAEVDSLRAAPAAAGGEGGLLDLALFTAHAHANRLGIHATQEATLRYLAWRARGGRRIGGP